MKKRMEILTDTRILIELATSLARKQLKNESEKEIMLRVQYLLAEQLVMHAHAGRKIK